MYTRILKKDLKRKKSMNVILLIFVMLATAFISSSINNLSVVLDGTNYFFEQAGIDDYMIITMRANYEADASNEEQIDAYLKENEYVDSFSADDTLFLGKSNFAFPDGRKVDLINSILCNSVHIEQQKFFDMQDKEITDIPDGKIYIPRQFKENNDLKKGDKLIVKSSNGFEKTFEIIDSFKDAFLGSDMMGTSRILLSDNDFECLMKESNLPYGMIFSIEASDAKAFENDYNKQDVSQLFNCSKGMIKITYAMDMVVAAILLVVSLCLIIISAVMLRFIIVFTINEDYKEIGIMKAIGIRDSGIRKLFVVKYCMLAVVGAVFGFVISIPFAQALIKQAIKGIIAKKSSGGLLIPAVVSIAVALVIMLLAYASTRRIKKLTPMDAIRNGNNGERFKRKGLFELKKSHMRPTSFMACNDVVNEFRKYIALFITSIVGVWLVVMPANTINTLRSREIGKWFSVQDCDAWICDDCASTECMTDGTKEAFEDYLATIENTLEKNGVPVEKIFMEVMFKVKISKGDTSFRSLAMQGINTDTEGYMYDKGYAPKYIDEVALAKTTANAIDAGIGDIVTISILGEEKQFMVTGLYQSMTNLGEGIRFHQDAKLDFSDVSGVVGVQVIFKDQDHIEEYLEKAKELFPEGRVENMQDFIAGMIGGVSKLVDLKILLLAVVTAIIILVVVLMQKMFLIKERGEIGMIKAVGFSDRAIITWQTKRISLVLACGVLIGTITGTPFSQITSGQVFKIMGASKIKFQINYLEVYVLYPIAILLITIAACVFTMRKVRKISAQDMNQIE
ncbi:MAG: ABC transporter permease [Lachnospiraceae bacterium]|nr:ABC transporter permease [Lachnospiraceae bacterium]